MSVHGPLGPLLRMLTARQPVDLIGTQPECGVKGGDGCSGQASLSEQDDKTSPGMLHGGHTRLPCSIGGPFTHHVCVQCLLCTQFLTWIPPFAAPGFDLRVC